MLDESQDFAPESINIPEVVPVLPIKGGVVFPNLIVPLVITDDKSKKLIDEALKGERIILAVTQKDEHKENPDFSELYNVGTASLILKMMRTSDGSVRVMIQGIKRVRIKEEVQKEPYLKARIEPINEIVKDDFEVQALMRNLLKDFVEIVKRVNYLPAELAKVVTGIKDPSKLSDFIASYINFKIEEKQKVLEESDVEKRLKYILDLLVKELEVLKVSEQIEEKVRSELDKGQREYILRQQLKAIQKELGITDENQREINELKEKLEKKKLPEEVKKAALKEIDKLSKMMPGSPEYAVSRNYIDWILELPWLDETEDNLDLKRAKRILNQDHYDLDIVKERIIEFLAVRKLRKDTKGPILCFVGPPGVGKTSLGMSIARAMGRKFVRMSLGGIRDEAEIRGHRRTYVGALPGRIIQGIKNAGSRNPVFMLDEIDKVGADFRGDPTSALLEVLDPEQNFSFVDHYLDLPFDLSRVFFIATANTIQTIPPALLDRMEVISLPGYVDMEKFYIARKYLIPKQKKETGLENYKITFSKKAILSIIREYTREAGVRNLERNIQNVFRKIAKEIVEKDIKPEKVNIRITHTRVHKYLGPPKFYEETKERVSEFGIVTGLAWTPTGGDILFIEALKMKGEGKLIVTGQLGDVMKESIQAAFSLVRSKREELGIEEGFHKKYDVHIHVPEGAIPKDGPSAGITIFTALVSLFTEKSVSPDLAMTGEITLRGKILPVGGIKEKVIAAHRAGIKKVLLPKWNEKNLIDIPKYVTDEIEFHFVSNVDEVIKIVFGEHTSR